MTIDEHCSFYRAFTTGDLIYGTQIDRQRYFALAEKKATKYTIDQVTRELDAALRGWDDGLKKLSQGEFDLLPQQGQQFLLYAQKTRRYGKMKGEGASNYTKAGVAKARIGLGNRLEWSEAYFRAKCKVGIRFVVDAGFTIRFVLDSLYNAYSMETVARKESHQPWHTGSELRYLYRSRADQLLQRQVIFYVSGEPVHPPWAAFPDAWDQYGKTRMDDQHVPEFATK